MTYDQQLKHPKWQKKRLEILNRDEFTCQWCGEKDKMLHIHHFCYATGGMAWEVENHALVTLCEDCHYIDHIKTFTPLEHDLIALLTTYGCLQNEDFQFILREANKIVLKYKPRPKYKK